MMNFEYNIVDNEVIITGLIDDFVKEINIPEFIDGYPVTSIGDGAFLTNFHLKRITIPNSVNNVGYAVFGIYQELEYINNIITSNYHNNVIVNNKLIFWENNLFVILFEISGDYCCKIGEGLRYFIYDNVYLINFDDYGF